MALKNASKALTIGRAFSTSGAVQQVVPAVAQPKSKGFLASIFGGGDRVMVPLSEPLPNIELPKHVDASVQAPKTNITTLSNGFRVASEDTLVSRPSISHRRPSCPSQGRITERERRTYPQMRFRTHTSLVLPYIHTY